MLTFILTLLTINQNIRDLYLIFNPLEPYKVRYDVSFKTVRTFNNPEHEDN
jgi:hypothetical protein